MQMKANKTGLVRLLRDMGQDIPSVQRANFVSLWQAMGLQWPDRHGSWHTAYLYLSTVKPALQIGCQRQFEIVRKRRRNYVVFRRGGG